MGKPIEKAAVIGAGWMGASIAAHLASAGIETFLLDILPPMQPTEEESQAGMTRHSDIWRNRLPLQAIKRAARHGAFVDIDATRRVHCGNVIDHLKWLSEVDWVLEAVPEVLDVKQATYDRIAAYLGKNTLITSNTSGIQVSELMKGRSDDFARRFLVSHFFNPVRFMRLMELVPGENTDPKTVTTVAGMAQRQLGKGVIIARDTPNFIANRLGLFGMLAAIHHASDLGITVQECDALSGPPMGRPKTATFRTTDMVGLDAMCLVFDNLYGKLSGDPWREYFNAPAFFRQMVQNGLWGEKKGAGFYRYSEDDRTPTPETIDLNTGEYAVREMRTFPSLEKAMEKQCPAERIQQIVNGKCDGSTFAWRVVRDTLAYAASLIGDIAETPISFDRAMRWGYGWDMGPFEIWDSLGVETVSKRMQEDGIDPPSAVVQLMDDGPGKWYSRDDGFRKQYIMQSQSLEPIPVTSGSIRLGVIRHKQGTLLKSGRYSLVDLDGDIAALAMAYDVNHRPYFDEAFTDFVLQSLDYGEKEGLRGLIIVSERGDFSVGLPLTKLLELSQKGDWDALERGVRLRQNINLRVRDTGFPVVAAVAWCVIGAGCEFAMHCSRIQAHVETQMGSTATLAGLIPSGGGCKEVLYRAIDRVTADGPFPVSKLAFDSLISGKMARGVFEARKLNLFRRIDKHSMGFEQLLGDAKQVAMDLAGTSFRTPPPQLNLPGPGGAVQLELEMQARHARGEVSDHDLVIGKHLARVLTGGNCSPGQTVDERTLLDLEREAYLSLCGEKKTQDRMAHLIKNKHPLCN